MNRQVSAPPNGRESKVNTIAACVIEAIAPKNC